MDVEKVTNLYVEDIKRYSKNKDTVLLTDLQKEELFTVDRDIDVRDIAQMYAKNVIGDIKCLPV